MPIVIQEKERQKRLIFALLAVFIITSLVLWFGFFQPSYQMGKIEPTKQKVQIEEVQEIDFTVLENPFLKELQPFEEVKPFEGKIGKENPFTPF